MANQSSHFHSCMRHSLSAVRVCVSVLFWRSHLLSLWGLGGAQGGRHLAFSRLGPSALITSSPPSFSNDMNTLMYVCTECKLLHRCSPFGLTGFEDGGPMEVYWKWFN